MRKPDGDFFPSSFKAGRRVCRDCDKLRQRELRVNLDLHRRIAKALYHVSRRRGHTKSTVTVADVRRLFTLTDQKSVISGRPAECLALINSDGPIAAANLAPVTLLERRKLGLRVSSPWPECALASLELLAASTREV